MTFNTEETRMLKECVTAIINWLFFAKLKLKLFSHLDQNAYFI